MTRLMTTNVHVHVVSCTLSTLLASPCMQLHAGPSLQHPTRNRTELVQVKSTPS
ncbi:hypothetical protein PF008_g29355 [Phytophthora fragariae]|uniref:RxLR effector protein n=1 Tax=Phytophthora fragariae TaxID=53985 RepID=A0A6G0Q964_9STRA|nr:hypothetical protein PF008_g29355 [Phytophthora fragariae]